MSDKFVGGVFPPHHTVMTVKEYAKFAKISEQAVTAGLRKNKPHSGIIRYHRFGHQWSLNVIKAKIEIK